MKWLIRRIFKRVKQRHPIEVYYGGKLVLAGSGTIHSGLDSKYEAVIKIERALK